MPTVTVAPSGGDYTTPWAAITAITDASSSNVYTVNVQAGSYQLPNSTYMTMKAYVNIIGASQATVNILGDEFTDQIVEAASNADIKNVTLTAFAVAQDGIWVQGKTNITISGCKLDGCGRGVYITNSGGTVSSLVTVTGNTCNCSNPIWINAGERCVFSGNSGSFNEATYGQPGSGMCIGLCDLTAASTAKNNVIANNTWTFTGTSALADWSYCARLGNGDNDVYGNTATVTSGRQKSAAVMLEGGNAYTGLNRILNNVFTMTNSHATPSGYEVYVNRQNLGMANMVLKGNTYSITINNAPSEAMFLRVYDSATEDTGAGLAAQPVGRTIWKSNALGTWAGATPTEKRRNVLVVPIWKAPRHLSRTSLRGTRRN